VRILRNEKRIAPSEIGIALPIDPGPVTITADADGHQRWETTINVPEKNGSLEVVIKLGPLVGSGTPTTTTNPVTPPPVDQPPPTQQEKPKSSVSALRIVGIGVGVLGLAAIGVGTGLALAAKSNYDTSNQNGRCMNDFCTPEGLKIRSDAKSMADIATVLFIAGGALAVTGVTLFIVAPKIAAFVPALGPHYAGASLSLAFE
jgi:hypothetical protein